MLIIATESDDDPDNDSDDNINDCSEGNKVYVTGKELFLFFFFSKRKTTSETILFDILFTLGGLEEVKQIRVCNEACSKCTVKN